MVIFDNHEYLTEEEKRLKEDRDRVKYWKKWGPYVSERQWATGMFLDPRTKSNSNAVIDSFPTVREDYSADGDAWSRECRAMSFPGSPSSLMLTAAGRRLPSRARPFPNIPLGRGWHRWRL